MIEKGKYLKNFANSRPECSKNIKKKIAEFLKEQIFGAFAKFDQEFKFWAYTLHNTLSVASKYIRTLHTYFFSYFFEIRIMFRKKFSLNTTSDKIFFFF